MPGGWWLLFAGLATFIAGGTLYLHRKRRERERRRVPGIEAFASSLGRPPEDDLVVAVYSVLVDEGGEELTYARGDDDLGDEFGIVEEDLDDLVIAAMRRQGHVDLKSVASSPRPIETPRDLVEYLEYLSNTSPG